VGKPVVSFGKEASYKKLKVLEEIVKILDRLPRAPRGTATRLVRADRDSH